MAWFNGTFHQDNSTVSKDFPIMVTKTLRMSRDHRNIAIINDLSENDPLYPYGDPHSETDMGSEYVFYHVIKGSDVQKAQRALALFRKNQKKEDHESIHLLRKEPEDYYLYSFGLIDWKSYENQKALKEKIGKDVLKDEKCLILPLRRFQYKCPCCGERTIRYRGWYEICHICGWEDEGGDDEDYESGPNYTSVREYRKKHLEMLENDPNYTWRGYINEHGDKPFSFFEKFMASDMSEDTM